MRLPGIEAWTPQVSGAQARGAEEQGVVGRREVTSRSLVLLTLQGVYPVHPLLFLSTAFPSPCLNLQ